MQYTLTLSGREIMLIQSALAAVSPYGGGSDTSLLQIAISKQINIYPSEMHTARLSQNVLDTYAGIAN